MQRVVIAEDVARLVRAAERMARLAQDIATRERETERPSSSNEIASGSPVSVPQVPGERLVHASRHAITAHLQQPDFGAPTIFRNPEWLLMLELFVAGHAKDPVSIKAASLTLGRTPSSANRAILELERRGLVASVSDVNDARRRLLQLTPYAESVLRDYLSRQSEYRQMPLRVSLKVSQSAPDHIAQEDGNTTYPLSDRSAPETETVLS
jgi:DNA-binding MarR family transcriptional regulator